MKTLIILDSETEDGNSVTIDASEDINPHEMYILSKNDYGSVVTRLSAMQIIQLVKVLHDWLEK